MAACTNTNTAPTWTNKPGALHPVESQQVVTNSATQYINVPDEISPARRTYNPSTSAAGDTEAIAAKGRLVLVNGSTPALLPPVGMQTSELFSQRNMTYNENSIALPSDRGTLEVSGANLMYEGARVKSWMLGRDVNPAGRGDGAYYAQGAFSIGSVRPSPTTTPVGGWGNSVNNGCEDCSSDNSAANQQKYWVDLVPPPKPFNVRHPNWQDCWTPPFDDYRNIKYLASVGEINDDGDSDGDLAFPHVEANPFERQKTKVLNCREDPQPCIGNAIRRYSEGCLEQCKHDYADELLEAIKIMKEASDDMRKYSLEYIKLYASWHIWKSQFQIQMGAAGALAQLLEISRTKKINVIIIAVNLGIAIGTWLYNEANMDREKHRPWAEKAVAIFEKWISAFARRLLGRCKFQDALQQIANCDLDCRCRLHYDVNWCLENKGCNFQFSPLKACVPSGEKGSEGNPDCKFPRLPCEKWAANAEKALLDEYYKTGVAMGWAVWELFPDKSGKRIYGENWPPEEYLWKF